MPFNHGDQVIHLIQDPASAQQLAAMLEEIERVARRLLGES